MRNSTNRVSPPIGGQLIQFLDGLELRGFGVLDVLKQPEFAEAFRKARREAFSQSVARLQHASNAVVGTLLRVMTDKEASASSRVRAAEVVLTTAFKGIELAISRLGWPNWNRHRREENNK